MDDPATALSVSGGRDVALSSDRVFGPLGDERRPRLPRVRGDGTLRSGTAARRLTGREPSSGDAPPADEVELLPYHRYLSRLRDAGVVDHDSVSYRIRCRGNWLLETLLDRVDGFDRS